MGDVPDLARTALRLLGASALAAAILFAAAAEAHVPASREARALHGQLNRCWDRATAETDPPRAVRYDVVVEIRAGRAHSVTIEGPELGGLKPCVRAALRRHPWPDGDHRVAFPLVFTAHPDR